MGALSVGDVRTGTIPSLLPSQKHYLKVYNKYWQGTIVGLSLAHERRDFL
ncbi:MAG: hypothetical protein V1736_02760 [Pseudomonadota bacterium]